MQDLIFENNGAEVLFVNAKSAPSLQLQEYAKDKADKSEAQRIAQCPKNQVTLENTLIVDGTVEEDAYGEIDEKVVQKTERSDSAQISDKKDPEKETYPDCPGNSKAEEKKASPEIQVNEKSEGPENTDTTPSDTETLDNFSISEIANDKHVTANANPAIDQPNTEGSNTEVSADCSDTSEVEALRSEIDSLRAQLAAQRQALERMTREYEEFREIFPESELSSLPEDVWDSVRRGVPLAAAYAYELAKQKRQKERADEVNRTNRDISPGALDIRGTADYFSPREVRAMSAEEVRKNYDKIIGSMKLWG